MWIRQRCSPERDDGVALEFINGTATGNDDVTHRREIFVEQMNEFGGGHALRKGRETGDIRKIGRHFSLFAT